MKNPISSVTSPSHNITQFQKTRIQVWTNHPTTSSSTFVLFRSMTCTNTSSPATAGEYCHPTSFNPPSEKNEEKKLVHFYISLTKIPLYQLFIPLTKLPPATWTVTWWCWWSPPPLTSPTSSWRKRRAAREAPLLSCPLCPTSGSYCPLLIS